jgi:hypothetical protein
MTLPFRSVIIFQYCDTTELRYSRLVDLQNHAAGYASMAVRTKTQALEALRGMASQISPVVSPQAQPSDQSAASSSARRGRPPAPEETMQISLRLPKAWHTALRRLAVEASVAEERTISPQEIVRRLVGQGLRLDG